jgi:hypothetical protein
VVTRADRAIGTPYYMAPEQWFGGGIIDARTDIYSLGCVFFEMLTGRPPFHREDGMAMMHAHLEEKAPGVRSLAPETPEALDTLVTQMLAKSPNDRPETMLEVVRAIEAYLERYRHGFEELLNAPVEHPVASGAARQYEPTELGVGTDPGHPSQATAPLTADSRRRAMRISAAAALALVGLIAFLAAGSLFTRDQPATARTPAPTAAAPPAPPPPTAPAPAPAPVPLAPAPPAEEPAARAAVVPAPRPAASERRPTQRPPQRPRNVYRPVGD